MHRPAQRDQRDQCEQRRPLERREEPARRASRLHRVALVCAAAVPVMLAASGCSSDSGSGDDAQKEAATSSAQPSQSASEKAVQKAAYATLPQPCDVLAKKTLEDLVPKAGKSGKAGASNESGTRGSCSWDSLDNNGVKGSQFRWLNVSLLRFDSDAARGEGNQLAQEYYVKQVKDAQAVEGAKNSRTQPVSGTGDEATAVRYDLKKKEGSFKQQTVVTRVENVVVTLDYNGAGLAGEKTPDAADLTKAAEKAAKETVAAVIAANQGDGKASGSAAPSKEASKSASPSKSASKPASGSASKGASKSASPSASASKKN
ncbi:DUF3558 family protein [Streptomyces avermitilis]|uniref:DUF3558 family protein n=1 Tax=Streptomyces avermitilis TaxID=33903 RepID=UPI0033B52F65